MDSKDILPVALVLLMLCLGCMAKDGKCKALKFRFLSMRIIHLKGTFV